MSQDDDRPGFLDREKKSFAELDRARRERRDGRDTAPRGAAASARAKTAARQQLARADALFGGKREQAQHLSRALHDARGTPGLADACRSYLEGLGPPTEVREIRCFLEAGSTELVLVGLAALRARCEAGSLEGTPGLRTQLRMLAQDSDDHVAGAAEEILERI